MRELANALGLMAAAAAGVGALFLIGGGAMLRSLRRFDRAAVRVPGLVVDLRRESSPSHHSEGPSSAWFPLLEFTTVDGRHVRTEAMVGSSPPPGRPGQRVWVLYDPRDPTKARVAERMSSGCATVFVAVGAVTLFLGLLVGALALVLLNRAG